MERKGSAVDVSQFSYTLGGNEVPKTAVVFYQQEQGWVAVLEWLRELRMADPKAHEKCVARIARLAELGHELRRPEADFLREGVHELRAKRGHVNYRVLYFFHGSHVAVLVHALKRGTFVPEGKIRLALERKALFEQDPKSHIQGDSSDGQEEKN